MSAIKEPMMGRFSVEVELVNNEDLDNAKRGHIPPEQVRRARISGIVDSGASRLVIPESVAHQLGIEISGTANLTFVMEELDCPGSIRAKPRRFPLERGGTDGFFRLRHTLKIRPQAR
jgi:predicted aspartyl protease